MNNKKLRKIVDNCADNYLIQEKSLFFKLIRKNLKLIELSKNTYELLWESPEEYIEDFEVNDEYIIYNSYKNNFTKILNRDTKEIYDQLPFYALMNNKIHFNVNIGKTNIFSDKMIGIKNKSNFIYNFKTKDYKEYNTDYNFLFFIDENKVVCLNEKKNNFCIYDLNKLMELWNFDISQFGNYDNNWSLKSDEDKRIEREIYRIYYYRNKLIVTLSQAIIAVNPENGKLLWKIDFNYNPIKLFLKINMHIWDSGFIM